MGNPKAYLAFLGLTALALLGAAGAAARPGGALLLGVPSGAAVLCVFLGALLLVLLVGVRGAAPVAGFSAFLVLILGPWIPGVSAVSGTPLLAVVLAGIAILAATGRRVWTSRALFPVTLLLFALVAARVRTQVGPEGDEPHYLMVADALLRDHGLSVEKCYAEGRYRAFHPAPLAPHYRVRGRDGHIYSLHAVGLSLLILPAYALGGYAGASFFMAFLGALLVREIRGLVSAWSENPSMGEGIGWVVGLGAPIIHYAGLIFTEVPAALIVALVLRGGTRTLLPRAALGLGLAAAFLPWLNVRYAPLTLLLLLYLLAGKPPLRAGLAAVIPSVLSGLALAAYHFVLFGFFDPRRVYGAHPELSWRAIPEGLQGLLLDQEFGLLVYAPVFILALPGLFGLCRQSLRRGAVAAGLVLVVAVTAASWPMWRGGFNPPGRFLLPVVPALAAGVAFRLRRGLGGAAALLIGWTLFTGLVGAHEPRLVHRDRDGTAPLFREASGAVEWTRLLPRFVLAEDDRYALGLLWGATLLVAALVPAGDATLRGCALSSLALLAASGAATGLGEGKSDGREAVRLVGRRAVALPGFTGWARAPGVWGPESLEWGPLYEPHRHPGGVELGSRFALPPARYRLSLRADVLGTQPPPELSVAGRAVPFQETSDGWEGRFEVEEGLREETLLLLGGPPFLLKEITLEAQP
jgi:hypothetical protein